MAKKISAHAPTVSCGRGWSKGVPCWQCLSTIRPDVNFNYQRESECCVQSIPTIHSKPIPKVERLTCSFCLSWVTTCGMYTNAKYVIEVGHYMHVHTQYVIHFYNGSVQWKGSYNGRFTMGVGACNRKHAMGECNGIGERKWCASGFEVVDSCRLMYRPSVRSPQRLPLVVSTNTLYVQVGEKAWVWD